GISPELLTHQESKKLLAACQQMKSYIDIVELRSITRGTTIEDIIVVDFGDGSVPSRNPFKINVSERLAITYRPHSPNHFCPYEVRALRKDFPLTPHQNHVNQGEPRSLCLYFEPWSTLERSWTPQNHLKRIGWWLQETARGTLHRGDQPLEQLYFISPWKVILPSDFHELVRNADNRLILDRLSQEENIQELIVTGQFTQEITQQKSLECLTVTLPPLLSEEVEEFPHTLGVLHKQLNTEEINIIKQISAEILSKVNSTALKISATQNNSFTFIILSVPRIRERGGAIERFDTTGFIVKGGIAEIGISMGLLFKNPEGDEVYPDTSIKLGYKETKESWKDIPIFPVDVKLRASKNYAREASGLSKEHSEFCGILAGVGALGSCLAEIWSKECWGSWTYIDDDILEPHNIIRHIGKDIHVGQPKVDVVKEMTQLNYPNESESPNTIRAKINDFNNKSVRTSIENADLLVDITTTLEAPRDLSSQQKTPRMVSVFVTPSGRDSVMLFEDKEQLIKLASLEAQYYRALLQEDWGETHLQGSASNLWVGAGCRDASAIMSNELIQLHGAVLARQIRKHSQKNEAKITVWINDDKSGSIRAVHVPTHHTITKNCGEWSVHWDSGLQKQLFRIRTQHLPNETGGILLGYIDQKMKMIHLVDASSAPPDSTSKPSEFVRGKKGIKRIIEKSETQTTGIVTYIGEWHSHPPNTSTTPSRLDVVLLDQLSNQMASDGLPCVMLIIGESTISCSLGQH
ncbi:MAG: Mov34/MPN/PAD-1 family protein, partial [bacterium]